MGAPVAGNWLWKAREVCGEVDKDLYLECLERREPGKKEMSVAIAEMVRAGPVST